MSDVSHEQRHHREALGRAYSVWMRRNGFSQQTSHDWSAAVGANGPHNSQVSLFQRGKLDPIREILAGWDDWSLDEINSLSIPGRLGKPAQALQRWGGTPMVDDALSERDPRYPRHS